MNFFFSIFIRFSLYREALKQSAVDPSTGRVDINILAAGISATTRHIVDQLAEAIRSELSQRHGILVSLKQLMQRLRQNDLVDFRNFTKFFMFLWIFRSENNLRSFENEEL